MAAAAARPLFRLTGDHLPRDPADHLEAVGLTVDRFARSKWGIVEEVIAHSV